MVQPLFFTPLARNLKVGESFTLSGDEGKHAATVKRLRASEGLQLTDGTGIRISAIVIENKGQSLEVRITEISDEPLPELQITLVQALAKGDRDELAIQAATELGATEIVPWQANRCVSKWEGPKLQKGVARWQTIVVEAVKQSLRVHTPKVQAALNTSELAKTVASFDLVLVLDPTSEVSIKSVAPTSGRVAIVVGPEGGIEDTELALLEEAGAKRVHLGNGILRTSTAGLAAISALLTLGSSWD